MLLKLAMRNIWRNKRRTIITATSIFIAVFAAVSVESLKRGVWDNMINGVVNGYTGFVQVHQKGYWEERSIDQAFSFDESFQNLDQKVSNIKAVIPRIESFVLASHKEETKGGLLVGIDPTKENNLTKLADKLIEGAYLEAEDNAVLLAEGLAEELELTIGDSIVFISQGYRATNADGIYKVKGILEFKSPDQNRKMVYMPLKCAQDLFALNEDGQNLVTALAFKINDKNHIPKIVETLKADLDTETEYDVMTWEEMLPELTQTRELDEGGSKVSQFILYLIITFGIFGTVLMMTKERVYEFGVLLSIGMKRTQLTISIWLEIVLIGFLGTLVGILGGYGLVYYLYNNPIKLTGEIATIYEDYGINPILITSLDFDIFLKQALTVFIITSLLALYPLLKIRRLKPVEAMRS
ncbi:MAG: FtsX-like permease family protein [Saprospiraceae bacterium]|nr:FtsX-like permease family protein [Saprospiraceae bacterium]